MRILLDTNVLIHREAATVRKPEVGVLFGWLDKLGIEKCIHPLSLAEIRSHDDQRVVNSFNIKLSSYVQLQTLAPESPPIEALRKSDSSTNSHNDTSILKELYAKRVDFLLTEDRGIHAKARLLGVSDKVFTIDDFLEKVTAEHPELTTYKVLSVKRVRFGQLNLVDSFFDSFRSDYRGFDEWYNRKSDDYAYACCADDASLLAFLYLKVEDEREPYPDITPLFSAKRRLKIGTFKVTMNGYKLGERFLKIVFDNAIIQRAEEIYVTIFEHDADQDRLIKLLQDWGFVRHGYKTSFSGRELVLVRKFEAVANRTTPKIAFPYMARAARKYIVPIYPAYHTELLPDSILRTEDAEDFEDNKPNRNAIRKVYISRSYRRDMQSGDIVVFYRTASGGHAHHTSVATTLGIVERVIGNIPSESEFIALCRKRSVFSDDQLREHWNYNRGNRPFVVHFLYTYSLPKRPNLALLKAEGIISEAPRGFDLLRPDAFERLLVISNANPRLVVD